MITFRIRVAENGAPRDVDIKLITKEQENRR
jgi:hypothetical protein